MGDGLTQPRELVAVFNLAHSTIKFWCEGSLSVNPHLDVRDAPVLLMFRLGGTFFACLNGALAHLGLAPHALEKVNSRRSGALVVDSVGIHRRNLTFTL